MNITSAIKKNPQRICVVTGSRADYGLLYFLMRELQMDPNFELNVVITGMHLSPEFGMTGEVVEKDGFPISARIETLLSSDTSVGTAKATALGILGFAENFTRIAPDLLIVLGDRFEIFAAAQAALFLRIPIAHIGGGDVTVGAFDDAIRHSISKLAHLHFVTNDEALVRLAHMGEDPTRIFNVGSPGLDYLKRTTLPDRPTLEQELDLHFQARNFLVTFHSVTLDATPSEVQLTQLFNALDYYGDETGILFTLPNADPDGRVLIKRVRAYVKERTNCAVYTSLGQRLYLGALAQVDVIIGNSSSGLYEAPSLSTPTVNIGKRQEGRLRAKSVFDCAPEKSDIISAIERALLFGRQPVDNPYKQGDCATLMVEQLSAIGSFSELVYKKFHSSDLSC